jgi:hypothetical protein
MALPSGAASSTVSSSSYSTIAETYREGIVAGIIGAAVIAIWFFLLDIFYGRPFYTPSVLGTALFHSGAKLEELYNLPTSFEMVLLYTWVHGMVFCVIGGIASKLLVLAERNINLGFGVVLLFVIFEFGFTVAAFIFAPPLLQALTWPKVLVGNFLAAAAMGIYFWRHHPSLVIRP